MLSDEAVPVLLEVNGDDRIALREGEVALGQKVHFRPHSTQATPLVLSEWFAIRGSLREQETGTERLEEAMGYRG